MAFRSPAAMGFQGGVLQGGPVLLEPIMKVEVLVPGASTWVTSSATSAAAAAAIEGMEPRPGDVQAIAAQVPLAEMFGYATDLRSMTQGRGTFTMEFDHYAPVPEDVAKRLTGQ